MKNIFYLIILTTCLISVHSAHALTELDELQKSEKDIKELVSLKNERASLITKHKVLSEKVKFYEAELIKTMTNRKSKVFKKYDALAAEASHDLAQIEAEFDLNQSKIRDTLDRIQKIMFKIEKIIDSHKSAISLKQLSRVLKIIRKLQITSTLCPYGKKEMLRLAKKFTRYKNSNCTKSTAATVINFMMLF